MVIRMNTVFSKEEINIGRQREFDYLKGIFMLFIYLIHAFQATLSPMDTAAQWIYMFATMSGAAIFIFVMGIGTVYSRNTTPAAFVKSGIRMVVYQYLNNIVYVAALLLPYPFVCRNLTENDMGSFRFLIKVYLQYTNIFFITGMIYFVLALLKKLRVKTVWYVIIGAAVSIAAPFLYGRPVDVPVIGYLMKLLIGEADFVSFTPLYFLSYALFGVAFGKMLRHVRNKAGFYKLLAIPSIIVVIAWWVLAFGKYGPDIEGMYIALSNAYVCPDFWHMMASLAHVILFAAVFFFAGERGEKDDRPCGPKNFVSKQLLYYSRHISKYYALHIIVYFIALALNGYKGFQSYQCWLLTLLSIAVTEFMVRGFDSISRSAKRDGV